MGTVLIDRCPACDAPTGDLYLHQRLHCPKREVSPPTPEEVEALVRRLRKQATCVYLACVESVAADLSEGLTMAATTLRSLSDTREMALLHLTTRLRTVEAERDELQARIANALL